MNITVEYEPNAFELAKASSLFIEKKPFFLYVVGFFNLLSGFIALIMVVKLIMIGLLPNEWLALGIAVIWLFGRRPFNEWLLLKRMKRSLVVGKSLRVEMSLNGIAWSGTGLREGHISWDNIKYVLEAQNGFLLPNSFTQFLWLPFRGFSSNEAIGIFRRFINEKGIVYRLFPKWQC